MKRGTSDIHLPNGNEHYTSHFASGASYSQDVSIGIGNGISHSPLSPSPPLPHPPPPEHTHLDSATQGKQSDYD